MHICTLNASILKLTRSFFMHGRTAVPFKRVGGISCSVSVSVQEAQLRPHTPIEKGSDGAVELPFSLSPHCKDLVVPDNRCISSAQSLHDLISMTLMKGSGLLDELDGLIGLLRGQEEET